MKKFKEGDKVRLIKSGRWTDGFDVGDICYVIRYSEDAEYRISKYKRKIDERSPADYAYVKEYQIELVKEDAKVTKKYRTENRRAKVGDRILITDAAPMGGQTYGDGSVLTVTETDVISRGDVYVEDQPSFVDYLEYEVIEENETLETRVSELETEVAALKAQLADKPKPDEITTKPVDTAKLAESFRKVSQAVSDAMKTPNQRRADLIKRAQEFVTDLEERAVSHSTNHVGNDLFATNRTKIEFHVNPEKGVVTALAKGNGSGTLRGKAFARCAPGDVFNADIGKAIAAGRLYGVKVPGEFLDAPQPSEVVVGHVVQRFNRFGDDLGEIQVREVRDKFEREFLGNPGITIVINENVGFTAAFGDSITDDTEAQYE